MTEHMDDIDDGKDINILDTITNQGKEFLGGISDKTVEAFVLHQKQHKQTKVI